MDPQFQRSRSYRSPSLPPRHSRPIKTRTGWPMPVLVAIFVVAVVALFLFFESKTVSKDLRAVRASSIAQRVFGPDQAAIKAAQLKTQQQMGRAIKATIARYPAITTGVATIDLSNGLRATYGSSSPFTAASTTKVLCAALLLHLVEQGRANLQTPVSPSGYTATFELKEMINDSDNDAWTILISYDGGNSALQSYAESLGLSSYNAVNNTMAVADEATLLQKLYQGDLLNAANTHLLLSYMQHTNDDSLIPSAVPPEVTLYHKYGLLSEGEVHDAAIMIYHNHPIVLVIYSDGPNISDYSTTRLQMFQAIVRTVLKYKYGIVSTEGQS